MAAEVHIDPDGVRSAGASAGSVPSSAPPAAVTVTPCAADGVSVQMATRLIGAAAGLNAGTAGVHARTTAAADRLVATAGSYEAQDLASSRVLARGGGGAGAVPVPAVLAPTPPPVTAPPGLSAGAEPINGHEASALIHGGPGADSVDVAAARLERHAAELEQAAAEVRAVRRDATSSWTSTAADIADSHLQSLETDYMTQAETARTLSHQFRTHAEDYRRAKAAIPPPQVFDEITQRLRTAVAANAQPPTVGLYGPAITALQSQLAEANHAALAGYQAYRTAAVTGDLANQGPAPSSRPGAGHPEAGSGTESSAVGQDSNADPTAGDALDGEGLVGSDVNAAGVDPTAATVAGEPGTDMLATVIPAVLGGVTGLVGGLVGGLSAAGQSVQQAATQLVGGLTQAATSAAGAAAAQSVTPDPSGEFASDGAGSDLGGAGDFGGGAGDFGGAGDLGGGDYGGGDTRPAAMPSAGPGFFPASAPVSAAPATFSAATSAGAGVAGAGGPGMMPPMMPMGMAGAAAGAETDRRLYPERRLKVESPGNAEPVKGRREARKGRANGTDEQGEAAQ